ncbi:MAG: IclR family transcriptional regulator [Leifsonia sp.]
MASKAVETNEKGYGIRAVHRVCDLLDALARSEGEAVALVDLAGAARLPKTSAFRYLATLEERRYVERVGDGAFYRLGSALAALQGNRFDALVDQAHHVLEQIRDEYDETTNLGVLIGDSVSYLDIVESRLSVRLAARPGERDAAHCTALGKALLAEMPDDAVRQLLGQRYERHTDSTLITWPELQANLERVRRQGFAVDDEENEIGGRCIAVVIPGTGAAISLSAPASRLAKARVPSVGQRLRDAAEEIAEGLAIGR